ncbi:MAG: ATP-binding cassette domain-containing protein [Chloroflexi bacterium]|nr:ATP-binding cassette domain-containing protein [Chloroflexota bacterium]
MANKAVVVQDLIKTYPRVMAVDGISFTIDEGEIFGLLGPNGAGKTTTMRVLLTLIRPTSGKISVFGVDALAYSDKVRQMAGYVPQDVSVDGELTGYENILMSCKLYGVPSKERSQRIKEALGYLELQDRAGSMVNTYSGGMMRRLEIAQALVNRPKILFLDEPSIGLDPIAKRNIWEHVENLRSDFGTTIILTTHDMNEADALCDRLGIMSKGKLITIGEPSRLKASLGGDVVTVTTKNSECSARLKELGYSVTSDSSGEHCGVIVSDGEKLIPHLLENLRKNNVEVETVSLEKSSLDDVFLKYTGARIAEGDSWLEASRVRRTFRRLTK